MNRFRLSKSSPALFVLFALLLPVVSWATVEQPVYVRWSGPPPSPARAGEELAGRFEIVTTEPGMVEHVTIEGAGWSVGAFDAPARMVMARGSARGVAFRARPADVATPLTVRFTYNGVPVTEVFRFDEVSLGGRRPPLVQASGVPRLGKRTGPGLAAQSIRFMGRIAYVRSDGQRLGLDNIRIRFLDDDSPLSPDELMCEGYTDTQGNFNLSVVWDDCDIMGCDSPDIKFEVYADNVWVVVAYGTVSPVGYAWPSSAYFADFEGSEIQFGEMLLPTQDAPVGQIFNDITRAHRYAADQGGMAAPPVAVLYPSDNATTSYSPSLQRIRIAIEDAWNEGTHAHEYGHHLSKHFNPLDPPNYMNGFCDTPTPGHCVWCPENLGVAWSEGWSDWYGSVMLRNGYPVYGTAPQAAGDTNYGLESPLLCGDGNLYASTMTEGFVGMLLRDIEDDNPVIDDHDGAPDDCDMDALSLGPGAIFTIFRDDDPKDVLQFIQAFRLRHPGYDADFWSTTRNVDVSFGFPLPAPAILSQPRPCIVARAGEPIMLQVEGNGSLLKYRWWLNGAPLVGGPFSGTDQPVLTIPASLPELSGTYSCLVSSCDGTMSVSSLPAQVTIQASADPKPLVSWGSGWQGLAADGTQNVVVPVGVRALPDLVTADGGHTFSAGLKSDGTVWTWGNPAGGYELGNGYSYDMQLTPTMVADLDSVMQIATGSLHTLALKRDGTVWGWGYNGYGNLGDGSEANRPVPVRATLPEGCIKAIACGTSHSLALRADGTVLAWGSNLFGELGRGTTGSYSAQPQPVTGLGGVVAISAAGYSNLALKSDGTVWAWGWNQSGRLGDGTTDDRSVPVQVSGLTNVRSIRMGYASGYAIKNDGSCWSWGSNQYQLLGDGSGSGVPSRAVPGLMPDLVDPLAIDVSDFGWCLALLADGTIRMWAYNYYQVLGRADPQIVPIPTAVHGTDNVAPAQIAAVGTGFATAYAMGSTSGTVGVPGALTTPRTLDLRAQPNPSFGPTRISFDLPKPGRVSLSIFDVSGRQIRALVDEFHEAGRYDATWDGRGSLGGATLSGVYYARLELNGMVRTGKVVRIR